MFIIEDYPLQNQNQHKSRDTLNTLNLGFHYKVTRALPWLLLLPHSPVHTRIWMLMASRIMRITALPTVTRNNWTLTVMG
jgi:hypothetical protein